MTGDWGTPATKAVEWYDPAITAVAASGMSGLEFLRAIMDGKLPPTPIASLLGMRPVEVEAGRVVFEVTPDESVYNPIGVVHGGLVCTLADTVAACAVHSTLSAGTVYTSIDLNVSYTRPVTRDSGTSPAVREKMTLSSSRPSSLNGRRVVDQRVRAWPSR